MTDLDEVAAVLAATPLAGLPVGAGPRGAIVVQEVPPAELREAWQAAHRLLPVTGRWPLLVADDDLLDDDFSEPLPPPSGEELAELDDAARSVDPWVREGDDEPFDAEAVRNRLMGNALGVRAEDVPTPISGADLDRLMFERALADPEAVRRRPPDAERVTGWFEPDDVQLLLLPTPHAWHSPLWQDFWGCQGDHEQFAAVIWQWEQRWGARLAANWGTMLQFVVERPPSPGEEAWELAGQLWGLARNIELYRWETAVVLPQAGSWFVHNRP